MLKHSIKPLIILFTIATGVGVLVHDTHIDKASAIAISVPAIAATYGAASAMDFKGNDPHTHTEKVTESLKRMINVQPRIHNRFTDEKKYLNPKKYALHTTKDDDLFALV